MLKQFLISTILISSTTNCMLTNLTKLAPKKPNSFGILNAFSIKREGKAINLGLSSNELFRRTYCNKVISNSKNVDLSPSQLGLKELNRYQLFLESVPSKMKRFVDSHLSEFMYYSIDVYRKETLFYDSNALSDYLRYEIRLKCKKINLNIPEFEICSISTRESQFIIEFFDKIHLKLISISKKRNINLFSNLETAIAINKFFIQDFFNRLSLFTQEPKILSDCFENVIEFAAKLLQEFEEEFQKEFGNQIEKIHHRWNLLN